MQSAALLPWFPVYGGLLIAAAILLGIWLVYIVEKTHRLPWFKMIVLILLIALSSGFGLHFLLYGLAL
ncbi:MAG: hypothetical protein Q6361_01075 [Candidatus Hermodarchaeota archaeon]|nr:hypothetical protein [Candidatus Hermodarchaeota archaeon]